jgi:hypothetical protein
MSLIPNKREGVEPRVAQNREQRDANGARCPEPGARSQAAFGTPMKSSARTR